MRLLSYLLLSITFHTGFSQLIIKPIEPRQIPSARISVEYADPNPATLPFWDDFSVSDQAPDDIRIWGTDTVFQWDYERSRHVFINSTLAINPPTYNVATFDGLDENGRFHVPSNDAVGLADELVSAPIDLSGKTDADNIYLSFFWQAGGNVELPEEGDSLVLQFLNADSVWITTWKKEGGEGIDETVFTQEILAVANTFLSDHFRFRFQSYGDLDGPFDAWHVDWVYLNENRSETDLTYFDRAFASQLEAPFAPFRSVPLHQFRLDEAQFTNAQKVVVSNALDNNPHPIEIDYTVRNETQDQLVYSQPGLTATPLQALQADTFFLPSVDFTTLTGQDSIVIRSEVTWKTGDAFLAGSNVDLTVNDTIRQSYLLHNYYAYDDGTAEYAVGTNVKNGQVAVRYWVEEPDTLTHIDIHFPNIAPVGAAQTIVLLVLKHLEEDGQLRAQQVFIPDTTRNAFARYELERPVVVADTFYVAYRQSVNDYIGIGFDRGNPDASSQIYENTDGDWIQNVTLSGALMMRPVFGKTDGVILGTRKDEPLPTPYPNPTDGIVTIRAAYESITLLDFSGRVLFSEAKQASHDLSSFEPGLYLLKIRGEKGEVLRKIVLR